MRILKHVAITALTLGFLSGCGSDNPKTEPLQETKLSSLKVVHAVSDAPAVRLDGGNYFKFNSLDFAASTPQVVLPAGTYTLKADAILPGNQTATVINAPNVALLENTKYTVFAVGSAANNSIQPLVVTAPDTPVSAGNIRVQVVHAAAAAPTVDIHVTAPDAALSAGSVVATLNFNQSTAPLSLPAGNYRVRITLPGSLTPVVYDSGSLNLAAGTDVTVAAINNRFAGPSPVSLLAVNSNGTFADLKDSNSTANVRVVHAVSDAPAVDVLLNNTTAIRSLAFPNMTGYNALTPGNYNVKVAVSANNAVVPINADLPLAAGSFSTILATGSLGQNTISPLVLTDMPRRVATEAKLRLVHASTLAGNVDIYVTKSSDISSATPNFSNVPFKAETGYVPLLPGDYVVTVTPAGSKTAAIGPLNLTLSGNKIYTAVARDSAARSLPLGLIVLDDFI